MSYANAIDWTQWYFLGFSKGDPKEIQLTPEKLQFLLSAVEAQNIIAGLAAINPLHLITKKAATAWHVMFVFAYLKDKEGLDAASNGRTQLFVPAGALQNTDINWPEKILSKYQLESRYGHPFVIPFLLHKDAPKPKELPRSLKSQDGEYEIFGVVEFNETNPEKLLWLVDDIAKALNDEMQNA